MADEVTHDVDLPAAAEEASKQAADMASDERDRNAEELARRRSTLPTEPGRDGAVEAVLFDAARKAEDAKRADEVSKAADLGNGLRVRQDMMEVAPPVSDTANPRGRKFDVGGQPIHDPENEARLRSAAEPTPAEPEPAPAPEPAPEPEPAAAKTEGP
jgi:peptidoglycan DL-endopeptidase CwlO